MNDRIVSIGFLSQHDLERLGAAFSRHIPVADDHMFDDLLRQLDKVEATSLGKGVVLSPAPEEEPDSGPRLIPM